MHFEMAHHRRHPPGVFKASLLSLFKRHYYGNYAATNVCENLKLIHFVSGAIRVKKFRLQ